MKKYLILAALSGFIISLDQWSKLYIHTHFLEGESVSVIQNFFNITYVRNYAAAFGFLSSLSDGVRELFFLSVPPIAAVIILFMLRATPVKDLVSVVALSGIFAGAIGNYIDRLKYGFVVDFLDFHYFYKAHYPAFNVADISIVSGISVMLLLEFLNSRALKKKNAGA
jgi:signal peptidase II